MGSDAKSYMRKDFLPTVYEENFIVFFISALSYISALRSCSAVGRPPMAADGPRIDTGPAHGTMTPRSFSCCVNVCTILCICVCMPNKGAWA